MDDLHRSLLNTYTAQPLDRSAHGRKDPEWLAAQLADTRSEYLILNGHSIVTVNRVPLILSYDQFYALNSAMTPLLLGIKKTDGTPVYLVNTNVAEEDLSTLFQAIIDRLDNVKTITPESFERLSLRTITREIDPELASVYSYATLLNHWHITTRFCTRCGSALEIKEGGSVQQCTNEECAHIEYPRINPAVIMRVTKDDKILLSRQENWPDNMYSVLAGFVEVGETLEQAVEREVLEEVNIPVENINYHSSQPWPFPNSMMLGYTAEACSFEFELEQDDIEHAMWLTADEMKQKMIEGSLYPSTEFSISHSLINDWFQAQTGITIKAFRSTIAV
ncbi:NAD(+) diphosphatase [Cocleimonas sp. KMM 6892]|uniref:NAD(+) diphosphatase n=1 Tax=unclassified Cocleimonas TaxID=2639732 RepID=UPI002DB94F14|nr:MULTISPECIES: NAD(+) diphosphatase [unclassified Cocleimonas]MEB8434325.1 NAD(+) diphosphatase [Cocleimonas sp. KMM 6892]MEC4717272.1 NAD(+) diphosphatase [Cocleimonas sp. KMM 6895]MEC4746651.1 NAD(+) diphosphatase [Cocleimonas sp. KMM 6896]